MQLKHSRYVVETRSSQGELLLYNVANGAFAKIEAFAEVAWGSCSADGEAAAELARLQMLTPLSPEEELARLDRAFQAQRVDTSTMTVSFIPTYVCNFRCPYCYELGHNKIRGKMDAPMMDAIMSFIRNRHAADGFGRLSVQWYGGDPSLALDAVEALTQRLVGWCDGSGIGYDAMMLTNANAIGPDEADLIARCRISLAFLTIDGPEEVHNRRRVAANGSNSYQRTIEAARLLRERGLRLAAGMNADKVNLPYYEALREKLHAEEGIELSLNKLNDYGHFYGEAPFCAPEFDLFEHEEFFRLQFEELAKRAHDAGEMREMLRPIRRFCTGQSDNYFIIDLLGDVYACDGWVGDASFVRFNILDDPSTWKLHDVSFDPMADAKCSACNLLPVCLGNCHWERVCSGMPCHPFKTTIEDYLRVYRACFDADWYDESGVAVFAEPFSDEELGWE